MDIPPVKMPFSEKDADEIARGVKELIKGGQIAMGPNVRAFEDGFARFCGAGAALGTGSGTQALELICRALELSGAAVMAPDLTFMATVFAPIAAGAKIVLVDIDPKTFQMDPRDAERKMRPDVRAVILVHLGGFITPEWERLRLLAKNNGAWLLEDAAHAHGAAINGRPAGSLGGAAAFSLYATKVLTTSEGGMAVTSDGGLLRRMEAIRQHGQKRPGSNTHELFGLNFRPSEIHALLGLNILPRAGEILAGRRKAAKAWDSLLKGSKLEPLLPPPGSEPSYYKYFALLPEGLDRAAFKARLFEKSGLRLPSEAYSTPLHLQPFWRENPEFLAAEPSGLGNSLMIARRHICLPVWPGLPVDDQKRAAEALLENLEALG